MNEGRVEHIGSPLELYDHRETLFVDIVFGSPAMNLVEGVVQFGARPRFVATDDERFVIPLTARQTERLAAVQPERVVAGIRPEDFRPASQSPVAKETDRIVGVVEASEPLGNEVLVYLNAAGQDLTMRAEPRVLPKPGDRLPLDVDPAKVHYFDRASGRSI